MNNKLYPILLLLVAMASIQTGASLAKGAFPLVGAQGITALRLLFASLILLAVFRPWRTPIPRQAWPALLIYGIALGFMNLLFYMSLHSIPLGIAVALEFTGPLAVALFSSRRPIDFLWVIIAIVGLYLLLPLGQQQQHLDPQGMAYALGAGFCWALYILFGQKAATGQATQVASLGSLIAACCVVPIGIAHAGSALLDVSLLPIALTVAVMSSALPYTLELIALVRIPARTFGTLMSIEPVFAALSGLIFLSETLSMTQWFAILAIICASIGATLTISGKKH